MRSERRKSSPTPSALGNINRRPHPPNRALGDPTPTLGELSHPRAPALTPSLNPSSPNLHPPHPARPIDSRHLPILHRYRGFSSSRSQRGRNKIGAATVVRFLGHTAAVGGEDITPELSLASPTPLLSLKISPSRPFLIMVVLSYARLNSESPLLSPSSSPASCSSALLPSLVLAVPSLSSRAYASKQIAKDYHRIAEENG
jgi:hypothetical protein